MTPEEQAKLAIEEMKKSFNEFKARYDGRHEDLEAKMNRSAFGLGGMSERRAADTDERKSLEKFLRTGEVKTRPPEGLETKGMALGDDTQGGYLTEPVLADEIISVGAEQGAIRKLARVYTPATADFHIPVAKTLAGAGRTTESGSRDATTTPLLGKVHPMSGGIYATAPVTAWLMNDASYDVASFVIQSIGEQFGVTESADFVTGDGVNKASGFLSYPTAATADATRPFGTVEKLAAGSASAISVDNLIDLVGKLAPRYRKNAVFVMHPDTETYVRKVKSATTGEYYWQPSTATGVPPTLLGLPVVLDVNMPTIAAGTYPVAVADWRKFYAVVDIGRPTILRDPYTTKGSVLFYSERRVGGGVVDSNAGKVLVMS
jgi:HK97 family phage major capsid protein